MEWLVRPAWFAGGLILFLLCWKDLGGALASKPHTRLSRIFIFIIFYSISLLIYIVLCALITIDPSIITGSQQITLASENLLESILEILKPLVVAFLGFGLGDASIFGFRFYHWLLNDVLIPAMTSGEIETPLSRDQILESMRSKQCEELLDSARALRLMAKDKPNWDTLDSILSPEYYEELRRDLRDCIRIESDLVAREPNRALDDVREQKIELEQLIEDTINEYISHFYVRNGITEEDRIRIATALRIYSPSAERPRIRTSMDFRNAIIGAAGGIVIGLLIQPDDRAMIWVGALAVGWMIMLLNHAVVSASSDWSLMVGFGGLAGGSAHLIWRLSSALLHSRGHLLFAEKGITGFLLSLTPGIVVGALLGLIVHLQNHGPLHRIPPLQRLSLLVLTCSVVVPLGVMIGFGFDRRVPVIKTALIGATLGAVLHAASPRSRQSVPF